MILDRPNTDNGASKGSFVNLELRFKFDTPGSFSDWLVSLGTFFIRSVA